MCNEGISAKTAYNKKNRSKYIHYLTTDYITQLYSSAKQQLSPHENTTFYHREEKPLTMILPDTAPIVNTERNFSLWNVNAAFNLFKIWRRHIISNRSQVLLHFIDNWTSARCRQHLCCLPAEVRGLRCIRPRMRIHCCFQNSRISTVVLRNSTGGCG